MIFEKRAFFKAVRIDGRGNFRELQCKSTAGFNHVSAQKIDFSDSTFSSHSLLIGSCEVIKVDNCAFRDTAELELHGAGLVSAKRCAFSIEPRRLLAWSAHKVVFSQMSFSTPFDAELVAPTIDAHRLRTASRSRIRFLGDLNLAELSAGAPLLIEPLRDFETLPTQPALSPRVISLRQAVVAELSISGADLGLCRFAGAHSLDRIRLEGVRFLRPPSGWIWNSGFPRHWTDRQSIIEEHIWRNREGYGDKWYATDGEPISDVASRDDSVNLSAAQVAATYRALRKSREDSKDVPGGGDFYYGEMEMRRHAGARRQDRELVGLVPPSVAPLAERRLLTLYWLVSGYGLRASRALVCWLACVSVIAAGLDRIGFTVDRNYGQSYIFAIENSISFLRPPVAGLTCAGEVLVITLRIVGPLFVGLMLLAIRARVKR